MHNLRDYLLDGALGMVSAIGLDRLMAPSHAGMGAILAFHRIRRPCGSDFGSREMSVAPELFCSILNALIARGYTFVSMSRLVDRLAGGPAIKVPFVCLTFDDGFVDTYTSAFSICRKYNVPMTVYLVSGYVNRAFPMWVLGLEAALTTTDALVLPVKGEMIRVHCPTPRAKRKAYKLLAARMAAAHPDDIRRTCDWLRQNCGIDTMAATDRACLTPAMVREMRDSQLVEFGAHSVRHPRLSKLSDAEAHYEIARSKIDCEALVGREIRHFAYPYGDGGAAGARETIICAELGLSSAVTTESNTLFHADAARPFTLPRLTFNGTFRGGRQLDLMLSGALPALRRLWHQSRALRASRTRLFSAPA